MTAEIKNPEERGNRIFLSCDRHEWIPDQYWNKIELPDMRQSEPKRRRVISLFLVRHSVVRRIHTPSDELEQVIVRKTRSHFYNISIRRRPVTREQESKSTQTGSSLPAEARDKKENR